jgi:predicted Zn-dependent protease with MMP-like domain
MDYDFTLNFKHDKITFSRISEEDYDDVYADLRKRYPKVSIIIDEHTSDEFERRFGI